MSDELVQVRVRGLLPAPGGSGVFLEAEGKAITLFIDPMVTRAFQLFLEDEEGPRPLTHDLLFSICQAGGLTLQQVVIHDCVAEVYHARIHFQQENELGKSFLEVDSRPSDAMVMALKFGAPVFVVRRIWRRRRI
ncbi:MAG: bifunctional nuclease family protein [Kiritimatiellia bacterium]